jgi:hypothetical protein
MYCPVCGNRLRFEEAGVLCDACKAKETPTASPDVEAAGAKLQASLEAATDAMLKAANIFPARMAREAFEETSPDGAWPAQVAPERIAVWTTYQGLPHSFGWATEGTVRPPGTTIYVRADLHDEAIAALRALVNALRGLDGLGDGLATEPEYAAAVAFLDKLTPARAGER